LSMKSLKTRILSALCAALMLLSLAACGGESGESGNADGGAADAGDSAPASMSKEDYLAEVEGLNSAAEEFTVATAEFVSTYLQNMDDADAVNASVEKIRESKQAFLDFQAIVAPAEGYEDVHTALAKDCGDFGGLIDEYCDVLLDTITSGGTPDTADLEARMQTVVESLAASIAAVEAVE